ncbi:pro-resilin-like [Penaeus monodon]|uniref:pro-resilin-like n=1 Tax=Penaeus monodon TaxID=6687 RepID=UPI0018A7308C|nr:pro-resilin-like [Penaeus monodon]XP_047472512.1 pro-resilin-like [Penaeus chinensis]
MTFKVAVFVALMAGALADSGPRYSPPTPSYNPPAPTYNAPAPAPSGPAQYDFNYAVKDDYSGNDFGHQESRNGYDTQGTYYVQLPDGRLQTVTYTVNGDSGYVAEVSYQGEAQYPAQEPSRSYQPAPAPSYQPAPSPSYQPAPTPAYG